MGQRSKRDLRLYSYEEKSISQAHKQSCVQLMEEQQLLSISHVVRLSHHNEKKNLSYKQMSLALSHSLDH